MKLGIIEMDDGEVGHFWDVHLNEHKAGMISEDPMFTIETSGHFLKKNGFWIPRWQIIITPLYEWAWSIKSYAMETAYECGVKKS